MLYNVAYCSNYSPVNYHQQQVITQILLLLKRWWQTSLNILICCVLSNYRVTHRTTLLTNAFVRWQRPTASKSTTFFLVVNHIPYVNGSICIKHRGTVQYVLLAKWSKWFTTGRERKQERPACWPPPLGSISKHYPLSFFSPSRSPATVYILSLSSAVLLGCALSVDPPSCLSGAPCWHCHSFFFLLLSPI